MVSWSLPPALSGSANVIENLVSQFDREDLVVAGELANGNGRNSEEGVHYVFREWPYRFRKTVRRFFFSVGCLAIATHLSSRKLYANCRSLP